ncbi:chitooligosaccharidolytic beta-N-acetylglucosaminidase-like [Sitophilus oryzae]|uniref:Beta-hexosaminidase n=1 Tax=Sitophilus oryzae TaxID=7048 RepID=A0A6J2XZ37_SITOR|nr:chitooligosaccharidolytic beta-N-acetylglucosaminidase-like [Sitophilus oryzae]
MTEIKNFFYILILFSPHLLNSVYSAYYYKCQESYCIKEEITNNTTDPLLSLPECNVLCLDSAGLWPKPTGNVSISNLTEINSSNFIFSPFPNSSIYNLVNKSIEIFRYQINELKPCRFFLKSTSSNLTSVNITLNISDVESNTPKIDTDENYNLTAVFDEENNVIQVTVNSATYFGARHGLETLTQLVVFDDIRNRILLPSNISISDGPKFKWRGIVLDTSRNFITPKAIKRTLKGMAASKLNTFHWHITDTASFPYVSQSRPELSEAGAYSARKVYDDQTVRDIVEYGRVRGIKVVPELDAPAHVGEGWQNTGVLTCFNWTPWGSYCNEPPCGQFDISQSEIFNYLEDIYGDMLDQFGTEIFHMGGDEININCWNNTDTMTDWMVNEKGWNLTKSGFYEAWIYFQQEAQARLWNKAGKDVPIILWSSDLTALDNVTDVLPTENYYIQVWTTADDSAIQTLLNKNYTIILSNYDALYLDCGLSSWVSTGNNWCSPYKGWQTVYDNKPSDIAGNKTSQVLGGEVALWTEQTDSSSVDVRLWPRAAALAETLWTDPSTDYSAAEERMLLHRERLVDLGINADALEPEWCFKYQQHCPSSGVFNV